MKNKKFLSKIITEFNLELKNKEMPEMNREISHSSLHRLGLELAGKKKFGLHNNIIGWGTKEQLYFEEIGKDAAINLISQAILANVPFVVLSKGIKDWVLEEVIKIGEKTRTPIIKTNSNLSFITSTIGMAIATEMADTVEWHGSLVIVNGIGVMITGKSGVGKSETVLELIQAGHYFVSDDTVVIKRIGDTFIGFPAQITKDMLEVRGIGMIDIKTIYGTKITRGKSNIDLIIELIDNKNGLNNFDRLGNAEIKENILGANIPKMQIPIKEGRSMSSLVQVAVNSYIAKKMGSNPIELMAKRREET